MRLHGKKQQNATNTVIKIRQQFQHSTSCPNSNMIHTLIGLLFTTIAGANRFEFAITFFAPLVAVSCFYDQNSDHIVSLFYH